MVAMRHKLQVIPLKLHGRPMEWYDRELSAANKMFQDANQDVQDFARRYDNMYEKMMIAWVDADNVKPRGLTDSEGNAILEAERAAEATRLAIKRKIAECADVEVLPKILPPKLRINAEDTDDVKAAKKKKIHAFKSKIRLEQMEVTQNKRQNAWLQFQSSKGKAKKVGFFTGRKRESIFKSPDDPQGKVGVTGSGKGITEFQKREKHLHLKVGNEENEE